MLDSVFEKSVWDQRRAMWWWGGGVAATIGIMVAFYPSIEGMSGMEELLAGYPEAFLAMFGIDDPAEFLTAAGFLSGELYSAMLPIIFLVFAIMRGAAATAGEEQTGTMDLTLSTPVSRWRVVADSFAAMALLTGGLGGVIVLVLLVGNPLVDMELSVAGIVAVNLGLVLLSLVFGSIALAVGAWTGRKGLAAGVAAGIALAAFFFNGLAPLIDAFEIPQKLSPFYWLLDPKPLFNGFAWVELGLMAGIALVFFAVAVWAFGRRDIST